MKRFLKYGVAFLVFSLITIFILVNRFLEPVLRERLHTLIIQGSDSLYTYRLGRLNASFFGGSVEVENLHIQVDSNRFRALQATNALPALTLQLDLQRGHIRGIGILPLVFQKRIVIREILSREANVRLSRHLRTGERAIGASGPVPLWKALQPGISSISIGRIHLDGIKMLYRNADTSESVKLQFDRCVARINDVKVDSLSSSDTARIGFASDISLLFNDLKFRTPDSSYKLKAETIAYSSTGKTLEVTAFKIQPTREDTASFYAHTGRQATMYRAEFSRARFTGFSLDRFIHSNIIVADSIIFEKPELDLYNDRTLPGVFDSKVGKFPHQILLRANSRIRVKHFLIDSMHLRYAEKARKTLEEGAIELKNIRVNASNVTNDPEWIRKDPLCRAEAQGMILGSSPLKASFTFYLDSANGRFDAQGQVQQVSAAQLNAVSEPLANVQIRSLALQRLDFRMTGEDFSVTGRVGMVYRDLSVVLRKRDEETGEVETKKLLTKLLNKFVLYPSNPGPDGNVRVSESYRVARLSTTPFFGLVWKTIFTGMQNVMMKSGRYE
ncbi:MAG TPA: hypothetical protein VHK69_13445 [Chitinophagaceae bacterium]|jgi:hypothetical protein|nr:hypothetical protein [Chitinophagaceae bacterium]